MKKIHFTILILQFIIKPLAQGDENNCRYDQENTCAENSYCVFVNDPNQPVCREIPLKDVPILNYPFSRENISYCWKSIDPLSDSSHAWLNARFAIDLHSPKNSLSKIYSVGSGHVIVSDGCLENNPQCNGAFGNQVKVFLPNGIMLFYAHLSKVNVKSGDTVKVGDVIGLEGATGNVGDMWGNRNDFHHLHFSVHYDWRSYDTNFHKNPWPGMPSVPFKFTVCDPSIQAKCKLIDIDVRTFPCSKGHNILIPITGAFKRDYP